MGVDVGKTDVAAAQRKDTGFSWMDNPGVKKLLDAVSSIIANEYIETAKNNREVFEIASPPAGARNADAGNGGPK